jgi:hypothetical protein
MSEKYPYPEAEHYEFPRDPYQQADDEMRLYPTSDEFRKNLVTLKRMYSKTPLMKSMEQYSRIASIVRIPEISGGGIGSFNFGFYSGALLSVHVNVAPAPRYLNSAVLSTNLLEGFDLEGPGAEQLILLRLGAIKDWFLEWAGQEGSDEDPGWSQFFDEQTLDYQERAYAMADLVYGEQKFSYEHQLDFLMGYTFASNMVWTVAAQHKIDPPVL